MIKRPRFTLMHILIVTAIVALIVSILLPEGPIRYTDRAPGNIAYGLRGIAHATRNYISDTGRYPRTLEEIGTYLASQSYTGDEPPRIDNLQLEGISYTPEFLGLSGAKPVILAHVPVEGHIKRAVVYFAGPGIPLEYDVDDLVMRSQEELEVELTALRQLLAKQGKDSAIPDSQPSPEGSESRGK